MSANALYSCAVSLGIVGAFIPVLCLAEKLFSYTPTVVAAILLLCAGTFAAHWLLVRPGLAAWWSPVFGWLLCLIPLYVYSYHIAKAGFFGHSFTFNILGVFFVLPPGFLALLLALIHLLRRSKG